MRIGFLGTGIMGAPMARHLADAGHEVAAWNRTREKAEGLGARVADSPAEAVDGAEVVVTMLTDGGVVEDVIGQAAPRDTTWWQASTVGIAATERLALLAQRQGLAYVDGPVLGTKGPAEQGQLVVLAAGPADAVDRCAPLFDAVGSRTMRLGEAGEATRLKLVLNHWVLAVTGALAETIALAEGLDVDPRLFLDGIEGGALDIGYAKLKGPGMIEGELPVAFPLGLALKDLDLVLEAAERHELHPALAPALRTRYARAAEDGLGDADMGMVVEAVRRASAR
ncbi:MAG: NAD(P)-dependent oxidoreductase [Solirubrobacterales bacterium]|nr:NAD(P)-dependent oxidoreductase [Solirubrobacterales bacterium]